MADWCMLPNDLLACIAMKLDTIEEFIYFSAVCRAWHEGSCMVKEAWSASMPWLLLTENTHDNRDCLRKVFSPASSRCFQIKLPLTFGARCWGSSYGWIVVLSLDLSIQLLNPITNAQLSLPSIRTMPNQPPPDPEDPEGEDLPNEWYRRAFVERMILVRIPHSEGFEYVVFAIHGEFISLCFARPGDQNWTPMEICQRKDGIRDVMCFDGLVFVLYFDGSIGYCFLRGTQVVEKGYVQPHPKVMEYARMGTHSLYIVELRGDIHVVYRYKAVEEDEDPDQFVYGGYESTAFEVLRLDFNNQVWEILDGLGDASLLIGSNDVITLHLTNNVKMRRNSLYFTDDEKEFWPATRGGGGGDMGMFDMESEEAVPFYQGSDTRSTFCPPIWFMPKF